MRGLALLPVLIIALMLTVHTVYALGTPEMPTDTQTPPVVTLPVLPPTSNITMDVYGDGSFRLEIPTDKCMDMTGIVSGHNIMIKMKSENQLDNEIPFNHANFKLVITKENEGNYNLHLENNNGTISSEGTFKLIIENKTIELKLSGEITLTGKYNQYFQILPMLKSYLTEQSEDIIVKKFNIQQISNTTAKFDVDVIIKMSEWKLKDKDESMTFLGEEVSTSNISIKYGKIEYKIDNGHLTASLELLINIRGKMTIPLGKKEAMILDSNFTSKCNGGKGIIITPMLRLNNTRNLDDILDQLKPMLEDMGVTNLKIVNPDGKLGFKEKTIKITGTGGDEDEMKSVTFTATSTTTTTNAQTIHPTTTAETTTGKGGESEGDMMKASIGALATILVVIAAAGIALRH